MYGYLFPSIAASPTSTAANTARLTAETAIIPIERRLDYLELACAGLWTLLKTRHGYTDEELVAAITEVDARDGAIDGKIGHVSHNCPHCKRKLLSRDSPKCSWCGGSLAARPL